jgi:ABC-type transporter Mla subunit MlaD
MALKRATLQQDILKNQSEQLSELAEYGVNEQLEITADRIFQSSETLNKGIDSYSEALKSADIQSLNTTGENLSNIVRDTQTLSDQINESLATIREDFANSLSSATESSIDTANQAITEANEIQEEVNERNHEIEEGNIDEEADYLDWDEIAL